MQTVKLGTLGTFQSGGTPKKSEPRFFGGKIPWISTTALDGAPIGAEAAATFLTDDALRHSAAKLVPAGSLLVGIRIGIGKNAVNRVPMATSQDIVAITGIDTDRWSLPYLMLFLEAARPRLQSLARGATIQGIQTGDIKNLDVPDLPLAEQQRIVRELQQVGALLANRRQVDEKLAELPKARFVEMFGDLAFNPHGWKSIPIADLCAASDDIKCGPFGTQLSQSEYITSGVPVWGIPQVNANFQLPTKDFITSEKAKKLSSYTLIPGDIVMSRKGNVGRCAVYPQNFPFGILHSDVLRIRVNREVCDPTFLMQQLHDSRVVQTQIEVISNGAIMAGLNVTKLKSLCVHLPPLPAQRRFAAFARACAAQRAACARQIAVLETLRGKLLQDAFGAAG